MSYLLPHTKVCTPITLSTCVHTHTYTLSTKHTLYTPMQSSNIHKLCIHTLIQTHAFTLMHIHICLHEHTCTQMYPHELTYTIICAHTIDIDILHSGMCEYIHTCLNIHMHSIPTYTCIHTYTYMQILT